MRLPLRGLRGHAHVTSTLGGGGGPPERRSNGGCVNSTQYTSVPNADKGGGVQKPCYDL